MNKKQWWTFIFGIICIGIYWGVAVSSKPFRVSNFFWTFRKYYHTFNFGPFLIGFLFIGGIFAFLIWAFRSKEQKITLGEIRKQESPKQTVPIKRKRVISIRRLVKTFLFVVFLGGGIIAFLSYFYSYPQGFCKNKKMAIYKIKNRSDFIGDVKNSSCVKNIVLDEPDVTDIKGWTAKKVGNKKYLVSYTWAIPKKKEIGYFWEIDLEVDIARVITGNKILEELYKVTDKTIKKKPLSEILGSWKSKMAKFLKETKKYKYTHQEVWDYIKENCGIVQKAGLFYSEYEIREFLGLR